MQSQVKYYKAKKKKKLQSFLLKLAAVLEVAKSCSILCDPIDCYTPDSSVLHYLLEFAQIHVHWVDDSI